MARERDNQELQDRIALLREMVISRLAPDLLQSPQLADALVQQIDELFNAVTEADFNAPPPPDNGLAQLIGLGPKAASELGETRLPVGVQPYDETVNSERIVAVGDLYYIYQHERLGVFRAVQKLKELFLAGTVRLSSGPGAYALYKFDRREVLRFTRHERLAAYRRAFGYGRTPLPAGARPNLEFHSMFTHFIKQVALFWRDKRISEVIRTRGDDPSFGSIAVVRRAGLDLRNNLKHASYGHLNVMRVEVMQLLDEAFRILSAEDIKRLFGAENAWDVIEEILRRYFNEQPVTSPRQRMAVAGRIILRWLAQPHVVQTTRVRFETLLLEIAEYAEEWYTSAQSLGLVEQRPAERGLPWDRSSASPAQRHSSERDYEYEL